MLFKTENKFEDKHISECYNKDRYEYLVEDIKAAKLDKDIEQFLLLAATRFIDINYNNVAQYYYSLEPGIIKDLFKKLNLVIVDDKDAIENGYVKLSKKITDNLSEFIKES